MTVLDEDDPIEPDGAEGGDPIIEVGDLTIAGYPDPLEWEGSDPARPSGSSRSRRWMTARRSTSRRRRTSPPGSGPCLRSPTSSSSTRTAWPQNLAAVLDEEGYSRPLTIVTGHNHYQRIDRLGSITIVNAGTLGAGGLLRLGQESVGLGQMYLAGPRPRSSPWT